MIVVWFCGFFCRCFVIVVNLPFLEKNLCIYTFGTDFDLFGTDLNRNKIVLFWFSLNFQDCFGLGCSV